MANGERDGLDEDRLAPENESGESAAGEEAAGLNEAGEGSAGEGAAGEGEAGEEGGGVPDWEAEARKYHDLYLRALAEAENIRRRARKDREETLRYASESLLKSLVPVLDNLNLALNYVDESSPAAKNLAEGVRMTLKMFKECLAESGFREVEAERGQPFDPNVHEALGQEPDPELPDLTISREVAKGYALGERLIRPAKVMVTKNLS
jgi:molecular chaperone GrpE